jgi:hypothetical protein
MLSATLIEHLIGNILNANEDKMSFMYIRQPITATHIHTKGPII